WHSLQNATAFQISHSCCAVRIRRTGKC
ncbi:uncharacterized protein METZ01_LOCUS388074, partial [marine metagenome]